VIIFSVSIGVSSERHSLAEISTFTGVEPGRRSFSKGDHVRADEPLGSQRSRTFWTFQPEGVGEPESMEPWMKQLRPILEHMADQTLVGDEWRRLYVGSRSKGGGSWFQLRPADLGLLSRAGCSLDIDGYDTDYDPSRLQRVRTAMYRKLGVYRRRAMRREKARVRARDERIARAGAMQKSAQ
jgi:hypothetical protein